VKPASAGKVEQAKFLELLEAQSRRDPLPLLASRHLDRQSNTIQVGSIEVEL
jgi:hypothetical protein